MAHPDGTRAWRKSHRRKWREGSTFRQVGSLAQRIVIWVEDNADDNGTVQTTTRYLAGVMSCYREPVNRMAVWRAIQSAIRVGLLAIPGVTAGVTPDVTAAMTLTRVNYRQYQDKPEPAVTPDVTLDESQAGLSGRRRQKETTTPTPDGVAPALVLIPGEGKPKPVRKARKQAPELEAAKARLEAIYVAKFPGASLPWTGSCFGYLAKMLKAGTEDGVAASWAAFLASKFYPEKSFFIFATRASANLKFSAQAAAPRPQPRRIEEFS